MRSPRRTTQFFNFGLTEVNWGRMERHRHEGPLVRKGDDTVLAARNCQFYTTSYIGTGEMKFTLTFPKKPVFFFISRVNAANLSVGIQGATHIITFSLMHTYNAPATWTGNSVTIECTSTNLPETGNYKDHKYLVSALLDTDG